jgi:hypothetical protein
MIRKSVIIVVTLLLFLSLACNSLSSTSPSPGPALSQYDLEYRLLEKYSDYFWCDPYLWPIAREGQEEQDSLSQFSTISGNKAEFSAILNHLGLPAKSDYSNAEKLAIFREHNKLTGAIQITSEDHSYHYVLRTGRGQGFTIGGTIASTGLVQENKKESSINTCPICLTKGTLIGTPHGQIPVEQLSPGMPVWTLDEAGRQIRTVITATSSIPIPCVFQVIRIILADGRTVTASPGHPSATGVVLSDYQIGDTLDGSVVAAIHYISYNGGLTFDILPLGVTGLYWANGILLGSTLFSP